MRNHKYVRILDLYITLMNGAIVDKYEFANRFDVTEKTIQRDIDDIRAYICNSYALGCGEYTEIYYDRSVNGYRMA